MKGNSPTNEALHADVYRPGQNVASAPKEAYFRKLSVGVYQVNGRYIRNHIDIDFCLGGNWARYKYIPEGEIWVEIVLDPRELLAVLTHERTESAQVVKNGLRYDKAHEKANKAERKVRKQP